MRPWRSLAAWYSAFSERSPWSRAVPMSLTTCGISTSLSLRSSSRSLACPSGVIGTLSDMRPGLALLGAPACDFARQRASGRHLGLGGRADERRRGLDDLGGPRVVGRRRGDLHGAAGERDAGGERD